MIMQNRLVRSASFAKNIALEDMAILTLDSDGMICHCNQSVCQLLNCTPNRVIWKKINMILPQLENIKLMQEEGVNPNLRFLSRIGHHFEVMALDGRRFKSMLYFKYVEDSGKHCLRLIIKPVDLDLVDERMQ